MKKLCTILALTALLVSVPAASFAATKSKASPAPGASPTPAATTGKPIPMYSEVSTIDAAGKSWTHKNKDGKEVKFVVTDKTDIKQSGAPAKFGDIKVGDWVSGTRLKKSDTEYEVEKITKFGPKTEKTKSTPAAAAATPAKSS